MENPVRDLIVFQIDRNVKNLFKCFLDILENQKNTNKKLEETLLKCGFEINSNSEEDYKRYRREILNKSNNTIRELTNLINTFEKINGDFITLSNNLTEVTKRVEYLINNDKKS